MKVIALVIGLLFSVAGFCQAQGVRIEENDQAINGVTKRGQQLTVQLDPKFVEKSWKDYLGQKAGKIKSKKGIYTIEGAVLDTISDKPMNIMFTFGNNAMGSYVWWNLDLGTTSVSKSATPKEYAAAEGFLKNFGQKLYREDVLRQINQAEDVLRATKAEQDRVVKQANDIQASIEKNKKRKQDLEAELIRNSEELKQLEQSVEQNVKKQEASRAQVQEMEKAVETVRTKLKKM